MNTTYFSATLKNSANASALFNSIKEMGYTPTMETRPFPNGRGFGYKVSVSGISEETKNQISATRASIEPIF